jgi:C4-type Zn-finger protein
MNEAFAFDYNCPVCGTQLVWVDKRMTHCGALWAYCPNAEPYLIEVMSSKVFGERCVAHGALDKEFNLMPTKESVD